MQCCHWSADAFKVLMLLMHGCYWCTVAAALGPELFADLSITICSVSVLHCQSNLSPQTEIQTFSCPTSSIPTIEIHSVIRWFTMFNSYQTIPTLVVFALPSTMPHTMMSVQCRTQCSDIIISTKFKISLTEFHNFDKKKISQYWRNFIILSKFS